MERNVFDRLHKASTSGQSITLSFAEVQLLWDMLGDELGKAETELERWADRFKEFERTRARDEGA